MNATDAPLLHPRGPAVSGAAPVEASPPPAVARVATPGARPAPPTPAPIPSEPVHRAAPPQARASLTIDPGACTRVLVAIEATLVLANTVGQVARFGWGHDNMHGFVPFFDLDEELNAPSFFSVLLLLMCAQLLALIATSQRRQRSPWTAHWGLLACGFLLMAFDEGFAFHERLINPMRAQFGDGPANLLHFTWLIPGVGVVAAVGLTYLKFLRALPVATCRRFLMAAALYLGGAIVMEMIDGRYAKLHGTDNWPYVLLTTVEETLEMSGLVCFIWALLQHVGSVLGGLRFQPEDEPGGTRSVPHTDQR
jgi:hypothetical protein